jgi:plasmid stability protein
MRRTTVFLDDALVKRLRHAARAKGRSFAAVVREALALYLARQPGESRLPPLAGAFASGHTDTSERTDELLWKDPHS